MEKVTLAKTRHRSQQIGSLDLRSLDLMTNLQFSSSMLRYDATLKLRKNLGTSRSKPSTLTSSYSPKILVRGFSQLPLEMQKLNLEPSACKVEIMPLSYGQFLAQLHLEL